MKIQEIIPQTTIYFNQDHIQACLKAGELEDSGDYEAAAQNLGDLWIGVGEKPVLKNFPQPVKADILLRIGSLTGWLGSSRQIEGAQEKAKNLICKAIRIFERHNDWEKAAEAQSDLGICYFREGSFPEAMIYLHEALGKVSDKNFDLRGKILLRLVIVAISTRKYEDADSLLNQAAPFIKKSGNSLLLGKLYFHRALVLRHLSEEENNPDLIKIAVANYRKAGFYYQQANHQLYRAVVENNLGFLLLTIDKYEEAHEHLDTAVKLFTGFKNDGRAALAFDAKARTYLAQDKLVEAELFARRSVKLLSEGDEHSYLTECFTTLGVILARQGCFEDAQESFENAVENATYVNDSENAGLAMLSQIEELHKILSNDEKIELFKKCEQIFSSSESPAILSRLEKASEFWLKPDTDSEWENFSLAAEVKKIEAEFIQRALSETSGKVTKAAELLGITHQNLSLMLKSRHIDLASIKKPRRERSDRKQPRKKTK